MARAEPRIPFQAHETARAAEIAAERAAEAEQTEKRIREAVDYAEANHVTHTRSLVAFLALSTLLAAPIPIPVNGNSIGDHRVPSDENEKAVVVDAGRVLLTPEFGDSEKDDLIKGLLGLIHDGSFHGLTCKCSCTVSPNYTDKRIHSQDSRLRAIVGQFIHPTTPIPSAPASPHLSATAATTTNGAPTAAESVPLNFTTGVSLSREPTPTPTPPVPSTSTTGTGFLGASASAPGSFQFLSASDLDLDLDPSNDITEQEPPVAPTSEWVHVDEDKPAPSFGVPPAEVVQESAVFSGDVERLVAEETADIRGQTLEIPISNVCSILYPFHLQKGCMTQLTKRIFCLYVVRTHRANQRNTRLGRRRRRRRRPALHRLARTIIRKVGRSDACFALWERY